LYLYGLSRVLIEPGCDDPTSIDPAYGALLEPGGRRPWDWHPVALAAPWPRARRQGGVSRDLCQGRVYTTVDRADNEQYRELCAPKAAIDAVRWVSRGGTASGG